MNKQYRSLDDKFSIEDVGSTLLNHLAKGLYPADEVLREYIQNAIDAHRLWRHETDTEPDGPIQIEVRGDCLSVLDYGIGMDEREVRRVKSIAVTSKADTEIDLTGHKGVGVWAGLSFFNILTLQTTKRGLNKGYRLTIYFKKIVDLISDRADIGQVMKDNYFIEEYNEPEEEHYTIVTLQDPIRSSEWFTEVTRVRDAIQRICPCPIDPNFVFYRKLVDWYNQHDLEMFRIEVDGIPIYRTFSSAVEQFKTSSITINDVVVAEYWHAIHKTNGKMTPTNGQQVGFRVVQSGFTLGELNLYSEPMLAGFKALNVNNYASWYVGEVHIVPRSLRPNLQRNKLEESEDTRLFIHRLRKFYQQLEDTARDTADKRNNAEKARNILSKYKEYEDKVNSISNREILIGLVQLTRDDIDFLYSVKHRLETDEQAAETKKVVHLKDPSVKKTRIKILGNIRLLLERIEQPIINIHGNHELSTSSASTSKSQNLSSQANAVSSLEPENSIDTPPSNELLSTLTSSPFPSEEKTVEGEKHGDDVAQPKRTMLRESSLTNEAEGVTTPQFAKEDISEEKEIMSTNVNSTVATDLHETSSDKIHSKLDNSSLETSEKAKSSIGQSRKIPVVYAIGLLEDVLSSELSEDEDLRLGILTKFRERIDKVLLNG
ncbi:MAG TPA: ATP-binding protein [Candidatus Nitrosopolaris rasttigaisensis]|nr:ATP-binding protein [Candidatus Nitrosopolaris rasttigaisensis]